MKGGLPFLPATALHYTIAGTYYGNSARLTVCLSVTRVDCIKTAEHDIEILLLSDRLIILVFRHQELLRISDGFTLKGLPNTRG